MKGTPAFAIMWIIVLCSSKGFSQPVGQAKEVFDLINMARVQPSVFLSKYRTAITECSPQFVKILEQAKPIEKVTWDPGIEAMQKEKVTKGTLNPSYPGKMNGFTLSSSGSRSTTSLSSVESIKIICGFYSIINDAAHSHFAIFIQNGSYGFQWGRSNTINTNKPYVYSAAANLSGLDFDMLNTAKNEAYMKSFEQAMIQEVNFARMYPVVYADIVGEFMQEKSKIWHGLSMDEINATEELIKELKNAKPFGLLSPKECVYRAAEQHGNDCKKRGFIDHTGSDGSSSFERIEKFCKSTGSENIVGTVDGNVRQAVIALLVDSGISSRGHRYNMLNPKWKYIGCYSYVDEKQEYPDYFTMGKCVQNFSE